MVPNDHQPEKSIAEYTHFNNYISAHVIYMDVVFHCFAPMTIGQTLCKCTAIIVVIIICLDGTVLLVRHVIFLRIE